ncbi:MAG TPA: ABC transporter ATP-binding protein [Tepiditoga sp.]|nr:ABC transporter ATP-binding protein [Thermotogota bacterium]HOO74418.1 ABC transporter ATP-binding protein [Tepiditoga sp.]
MREAVKINNLNKFYGDFQALKDINLNIEENKIYGLIGRNGAGKTTLMKAIANQIRTDTGDISVFGENYKTNEEAVSRVCLARETLGPYYEQNTAIKIEKIFKIASVLYNNWDKKFASHLIKRLDLDTKKYYNKTSKGMKTTVGIILGLASRAEITMFDEPYVGLDPVARSIFFEELNKDYMENPRTIIISSHLIQEFENLFENVIMINKGKIMIDNATENIEQNYFYLNGKENDVEKIALGFRVLSKEKIGGFVSYAVCGNSDEIKEEELYKNNVEISRMGIEKILVNLTREGETNE